MATVEDLEQEQIDEIWKEAFEDEDIWDLIKEGFCKREFIEA